MSSTTTTWSTDTNTKSGSATTYTDTVSSLKLVAAEGEDAILRLFADEGDDNADHWRIVSQASTNKLNIMSFASGAWSDVLSLFGSGTAASVYTALPAASKLYLDGVGDTYIQESSGDVLDIYVGGANMMKFTESTTDTITITGDVTVGVDDTGNDLRVYSATTNEGLFYDASEDEFGLLLTTKLKFHDIGGDEEIFASANGHLEINAGTTLDITAPTVDLNSSTEFNIDTVLYDLNASGAVTLNGTTIDIDGSGAMTFNSSGGTIGIGDDAVAQAMNIGTGAAARVITIGNVTGATQVVLNAGTAGISLASTGGVTMSLGGGAGDDFIVDTTTLVVESDNNRVGIGTAAPETKFTIDQAADNDAIRIYGFDDHSTNYGELYIDSNGYTNLVSEITRSLLLRSGSKMDFIVDEGDAADTAMTITDASLVGIGTTAPDYLFHVDANAGTNAVKDLASFSADQGDGDGTQFLIQASRNSTAGLRYVNLTAIDEADAARYLCLNAGGGNVGIGKTAPACALDVEGAIAGKILSVTASADDTDVSGYMGIRVNTNGGTVVLGAFVGGVAGQVLYIWKETAANDLTLENNEGTGNQDIAMSGGADVSKSTYGGWVLLCDGSTWFEIG